MSFMAQFYGSVGLRFDFSQIDVKVHDATAIAFVLRMQVGIVEPSAPRPLLYI